jgi:predicted methyltransferase
MSKSSLHEKELLESNIRDQLEQLLDYVTNAAGKEQIHNAEKEILKRVQQIGLSSLQKFVKESGTGYEADNPPVSASKKN